MARSRTFWSSLAFGLILAALLGGCGGGSSTASVPATATIFYAHSLAFRNTTTFAWGYNGFGQLGVAPSGDPVSTPRAVPGLSGVLGFSAGADHSVAFTNHSSAVFAWGSNAFGQLGAVTNPTNYSFSPVRVVANTGTPLAAGTPLTGITAVSAGGNHSLALQGSDGTVWAWGYNGFGQLAAPPPHTSETNVATAVQVFDGNNGGAPLNGVVAIAAGGQHSLALKSDGTLWAWGDNTYGQLGVAGSPSNLTPSNFSQRPLQVTGISGRITAIAAGGSFSLALDDQGRVWAWGYNGLGQLGVDPATTSFRGTPQVVQKKDSAGTLTDLVGVTAIAAGLDHVLVLVGDSLLAWGYNGFGQLGNNSTATIMSFTPVTVVAVNNAGPQLTGVQQIILVTGHHNIVRAVDSSGTSHLYAWGDNGYGQIGDGTTTNRFYPTPVTGF